jgi:beta-mannosidase
MKICHDLSTLDWALSGWTPHLWRLMQTAEIGALPAAEVKGISAPVPGSVQRALRQAGLLPDWNLTGNARACEWVENRHWIYETALPNAWIAPNRTYRLNCLGLDYNGWVFLNGREVGAFCGTHVPHVFDLTPHLQETGNRLRIVFDLPPRWLGQFGFTSQVREWKARFNYTWDWQPRLVQIGIWDAVLLEVTDGGEIAELGCVADADPATATGVLRVQGRVIAGEGATVRVTLERVMLEQDGSPVPMYTEELPAETFNAVGVSWRDLPVELWWPNGQGAQPLYTVRVTLRDKDGQEQDRATRRVGFRHIAWEPCAGAPENADPWLCVVNGRPLFLQGVNCPPLLPNFADVPEETYRRRLTLYRDLGVNTLRVNGVGFLEKENFYALCDLFGLLIWQDVPLSSSGVDNVPPDDAQAVDQVADILRSFILRRQHHASLLLWCGGNELHARAPEGYGVPMTTAHPLLKRLNEVAQELDPMRRFLPTTATGPRFSAEAKDFGKGLHWNTHGPWKLWGGMAAWAEYWQADDSLFRAESGAPGAAPAEIIRQYAGEHDPMPVSEENPVWRCPLTWWIEADAFAAEHGRAPETLEEYVAWSQARQAEALTLAVTACKERFPRCGGILLWCGHDCYPCAANTSIIDFHGDPKPAALALQAVWKRPSDGQGRT